MRISSTYFSWTEYNRAIGPIRVMDPTKKALDSEDGKGQQHTTVARATDHSRYFTAATRVPDQARNLLEQYSGFLPHEILPHVQQLVSYGQPL